MAQEIQYDFDRNRATKERLEERFDSDYAFTFNAQSVNVKMDAFPEHKEISVFRMLHNKGYRLRRFGEFASGTEFAEFVIAD